MPGLAALTCLSIFTPVVWKSGDLAIEVDQGAGTVRVLSSDGRDLLSAQGIESLAYVLVRKEQLTLTGMRSHRQFVSTFEPGDSPGQIRATTAYPGSGVAAELLDTYSFGVGLDQSSSTAGASPVWTAPYSLRSGGGRFAAIWPDPLAFDLADPMPGYQHDGRIGYRNIQCQPNGVWVDVSEPRAYPAGTSYTYVIQAGMSNNPDQAVLTAIWNRASAPRRNRAFPQLAPFVICAANTLKFNRAPLATPFGDSGVLLGGPSRWEQFDIGKRGKSESGGGGEEEEETGGSVQGLFGLPAGQGDKVTLSNGVNAMRTAAAMDGWGKLLKQADIQGRAIQLVNLIAAGTPADGFAPIVKVGAQDIEPPQPSPKVSSVDEAATAFYALRLLSQSPGHPETEDLVPRISGVIKRMPEGKPTPEFAALVAAAANLPGIPAEIRQPAMDRIVAVLASFEITAAQLDNPWSLEALLAMRPANPGLVDPQIESLVTRYLQRQSVFDMLPRDGLSMFGAFRAGPGEIAGDSPTIASLVGRAGIALDRPEWLDRAGFALRASHCLYSSTVGNMLWETVPGVEFGTAAPGFGNKVPNQPDPRESFEGAEGLLLAATYEVTRESGGAYEFAGGTVVGIDGMGASQDGILRNTLFSNPEPFLNRIQIPGTGVKGSPPAPPDLPGWPSVAKFRIELRGPDWFVVADPGLSLTGFGERPRGDFYVGGKRIPASLGDRGFEAKMPPKSLGPVRFSSAAGSIRLDARANLPEGSPMAWATAMPGFWERKGDLRWQGSASDAKWLSTADMGGSGKAMWPTGVVQTPWLTATGRSLSFTALGTGDCDVVLLDLDAQAVLDTWYPEGDSPMRVKFDLSSIRGHRVRLAIRDRDPAGFAKIGGLEVSD